MDKRSTSIIIIVAVSLICACLPLCVGLVGGIDYATDGSILDMGDTSMYLGGGGICLGIVGVIIAVVVGILTLRKKPEESLPVDDQSVTY